MAATTGRLLVMTVVLLVGAVACSEPSPEEILNEAMVDAAATSTTTPSTVPSSTTTTEPTTTTLSERDLAKAEIEQVVVDWYQLPIDTSLGEEGFRVQYTTGLLRQRLFESAASLGADGRILRSLGSSRIDVTETSVDLENGTAEVEACTAASAELVDAETMEVLRMDDPDPTISSFHLQQVDGQWMISEWIPSVLGDDPVACEIRP